MFLDLLRREGIHRIAFQPADRDGLAALADGAGRLAAMGTDATTGVRKGIGVVDLPHRLLEVVLPDRPDVLGRIHLRRAGIVAHAALHAARRLDNRLLFVVAMDDLVEVFDARRRCPFAHRLTVWVDQVVLRRLVPAFAKELLVHSLWVGQHEVAGELLIGTGVDILARQADRAGRAQIHAQRAPAAAAIVDRRAQIAHPVQWILGQRRHLHHADRRIVADLLTGRAADTRVPVVEVKTAIAHCCEPRLERFGDSRAGEERKALQRVQDAPGALVFDVCHQSSSKTLLSSAGSQGQSHRIWTLRSGAFAPRAAVNLSVGARLPPACGGCPRIEQAGALFKTRWLTEWVPCSSVGRAAPAAHRAGQLAPGMALSRRVRPGLSTLLLRVELLTGPPPADRHPART